MTEQIPYISSDYDRLLHFSKCGFKGFEEAGAEQPFLNEIG